MDTLTPTATVAVAEHAAPDRPGRRWRAAARLLALRTAIAIPLTAGISAAMFFVASLSPFDPLAAYLGGNYQFATASQRDAMRVAYQTDQPWYQAWWQWVGGSPAQTSAGPRPNRSRSPRCWPNGCRSRSCCPVRRC